MAETPTATEPAVDSDGAPETPVKQAVEKKQNENRVKAGIALAAIGIVVAIVLARRNAASAAAPSGVPPAASSGGVDGSGIDSSYVSNLQGQLGGLQTQLASLQTLQGHEQDTNAQLLAREKAQDSALAALKKQIANLGHAQGGKGSTPPEINASQYPKDIGQQQAHVSIVGRIVGGKYQGRNSPSGAPVYALVNTGFGPVWEQGFNPAKLPNNTPVATLAQFNNNFK